MTRLWLLSTRKNRSLCLPQERLQNLWVVYQRLGLEDDIVDPSNELIKEGSIQKISTRNNSTSEKYLFLVGAGVLGQGREQMRWEWGQGQHSLARVLLGHLDTEGMNSELGGGGLTLLSAEHPVQDTVGNLLIPGHGSPGSCFTFAGWEGAGAETVKF